MAIVGAGFGGLWAARAFAHTDFHVTLLDRNNYHTFLPLLYQVAAAEIEPEEIVYPVRSILRPLRNVNFLLADVRGIDFAAPLPPAMNVPEKVPIRADSHRTPDSTNLPTLSFGHFLMVLRQKKW